jgi:hypothetical protein
MRQLTTILTLDLSKDDKPDAFWQGYFQALAERISCPAIAQTTIASVVETEEEPVFLLVKRKYDEWTAYSGGGWAKQR